MRAAALSLVGTAFLAASALAANAAPSTPIPAGQPHSNIVRTAGGCGWGLHRNRWHRCVPNRYGYYGRPYWPGYYSAPFWPGYYGPPYWPGYYGAGYGGYYGGGDWQDQNGVSWRDHFSGGY